MKYLICEDFGGHQVAFLFPNRVDHADMREQLPYAKVTAAGYVELENDSFRCFGGSKELDIHARPEQDVAIILEHLASNKA
ncbi:MAG: hypothetical protein IJD04_05395 [Desulfovibrionaceae bacterium]|nr:hypothetical protein [Desulfovibrionaceae bacterium]